MTLYTLSTLTRDGIRYYSGHNLFPTLTFEEDMVDFFVRKKIIR